MAYDLPGVLVCGFASNAPDTVAVAQEWLSAFFRGVWACPYLLHGSGTLAPRVLIQKLADATLLALLCVGHGMEWKYGKSEDGDGKRSLQDSSAALAGDR